MNQTFSLSRFWRLLRSQLSYNKGQFLANSGLLVGSLFVLVVFFYQGSPGSVDQSRSILFFLLGWPCWYVFTVQQTTVLNHKERAINYLMQPSSQLEKIILIWLISGVGFLVVYIAVFTLFDELGVAYVNNRVWTPDQVDMMHRQGSLYELTSFFNAASLDKVPETLWRCTALLHAFTMAFALVVRRYTLALVVVIAFTLLIFGLLGNTYLLHKLIDANTIVSAIPFSDAIVRSPVNPYEYRSIELSQPVGNLVRYVVGIPAIALLYVTAYFRLKEREV